MFQPKPPTTDDVRAIVQTSLRRDVESITRFPTGLQHYVFDVVLKDGCRIVARLGDKPRHMPPGGTLYWWNLLRARGVPLPQVLYVDLDRQIFAYPYFLMERLPGTDLGNVYTKLSSEQKQLIAREVARVGEVVATVPRGTKFGAAGGDGSSAPHGTWRDAIAAHLERSRRRMVANGIDALDAVESIEAAMEEHAAYFETVEPTAFLDDTTTKNVLVENGAFSGVVDVDTVWFGDPLFTIGLTHAALAAEGRDFDYVTAWVELLNPSPEQRRAMLFYSAVFCIDLMSEAKSRTGGQRTRRLRSLLAATGISSRKLAESPA